MSIRLSLAVALAIYAAHWGRDAAHTGLCWLLLISGIQLLRLWHLGRMNRLLATPSRLKTYFPSLYGSVFLAAAAWGSMLFAFPNRQFDFVFMFKIIALAAINSVTILSHGLVFRLYALFSCVITAMVLLQLHGFDRVMVASDRYAFSTIALLYLVFLLLTAWKYSRRNADFFEQQVAMESLVSKLKKLHTDEVALRSSLETKSARLEEARNDLLIIAATDSLTKVLNRRAILEKLDGLVARIGQSGGFFSVIAFDVDNFKKINDVFGHNVGDIVLRVLAEEVKSVLRADDLFGRIGGEEFLVILPELTLPLAVECAERIRVRLEQSVRMQREAGFGVTMSLGCCLAFPGESAIEILGKADELMYTAKRAGRNRLCY